MTNEYVELHAHSYYSMLDGAGSPAGLVSRAVELGMPAIALTDHDNVYGVADFLQAAEAQGIQPILGSYSFAKSHASAFAVIVYQSAWLKCYFPAGFLAALLNNQPMGFWTPAVLIGEAKRRGIQVLPVDIARSGAACTLEGDHVRLGFNFVRGMREEQIQRLLTERQQCPFSSLADFKKRVRLPEKIVKNLIWAGVLDRWGVLRRQLVVESWAGVSRPGELDLSYATPTTELPSLTPIEAMLSEQSVRRYKQFRHVLHGSRLVRVTGTVQVGEGGISVIARHITSVTHIPT